MGVRLARLGQFTARSPLVLSVLGLAIAALSAPAALFGVVQLAETVRSQWGGPGQVTDFLAIYSGAHLVLYDTSHLYAPGASGALESTLSAGSPFNRPFSFLPSAALQLAPLALLDFGVAYTVWLVVGLVSLIAATWLLAPDRRLIWLLFLPTFLPVQFGLIMGQTSAVALLAYALFVRCVERQAWAGLLLGLSPLAWKPQLLPSLAGALAASGRWRTVAWLLAGPVLLSSVVILAAGPDLLSDYRANSAEIWQLVSQQTWYEFSGQTLFGLCQALLQPGQLAFGAYVVAACLVEAWVLRLWWGGLRKDGRSDLQLSALPIAAVLIAPHALVYELTLWVASGWLLLRYAAIRPSVVSPIVAWCLAGWATANVVTLTERDLGFPFGAIAGLCGLVLIGWLFETHPIAKNTVDNHVDSQHY